MNHEKVYKINKIITILLILFPIFSRYSSVTSLVSLSEMVSFLLLLYVFVTNYKNIKVDIRLLFFVLFIITNTLISVLRYDKDTTVQIIGTSIRLIYIYLTLNILGINYFDVEYGKKIILVVSVVLSIYAFVQYVFAMRGVILSTYIPGLPIMTGTRELENIDEVLLEQMNYNLQFRPRSLLNEPAHLATYLISALVVSLNYNTKLTKKNIIISILLSITCLLTRSSTAIIMMVIIWLLFIFGKNNIKNNINYISVLLIMLVIVVIITYARGGFDIINYFINRTFGSGGSLTGIVNSTRFFQVKSAFVDFSFFPDIFIGKGMIRLNGYLPGFFRLIYNFGLIGFISYLYWLVKSANLDSSLKKSMFYIFIIMNIGTEILFGNFIFLYLPFILYSRNENIEI